MCFTLRKRIMAALVGLLLLCLPVLQGALAATAYPYDTVSAANVNLRRSANTSSVILKRIEKGDTVTVLGASGKFYKVKFSGVTGYAMKGYIDGTAEAEKSPPSATPAPAPIAVDSYPYDTTTLDHVKLRKKASATAVVVQVVPRDTVVTVQGMSEDGLYAKVKVGAKSGYLLATFVNLIPIATPEPTIAFAAPAPIAAAEPNDYDILSTGMKGGAVKALQMALTELGFFTAEVDGSYGKQTATAVTAFQKKNKLTQDGVASDTLQKLLYEGKPLNKRGNGIKVKTLPPLENVTVRLNSRGELVTRIHQRLSELGYYSGEITDTYTRASVRAVKAFQKNHKLKMDGLAGKDTQELLFSTSALFAKQTATPTPGPTVAPPSGTVRSGDTGEDVKRVQKRLTELGYYTDKIDGKYGASTVKAVKAFQKKMGLNGDGVCGVQTNTLLFTASALAVNATATPVAPLATPEPVIFQPMAPQPAVSYEPLTSEDCVTVQAGSLGEPVRRLQQRLAELGYYASRLDGVCLEDDVTAIRAFQKRNALKVDGKAGYQTQSLLYSQAAQAAESPILQGGSSVDMNVTLRYGDSGANVTMLQNRLIALGYLQNQPADGAFGVATKAALIAFQRANGLTRDGVAGLKTMQALYSDSATAVIAEEPALSATNKTLRQGDACTLVRTLQQQLITLGYMPAGSADGSFGANTKLALIAFQQRNNLQADGIAGSNTWTALVSESVKIAADASPTPKPTAITLSSVPQAASVRYGMWYAEVRARAKLYPYATVYDFTTGISWKVHMFSLGAHADAEPLTAADTAMMNKAFGDKTTWTPKAVWVVFSDGRVYMASTHNTPHEVSHIRNNDFPGHLCIHFPRTQQQVESIGPYATQHQKAIEKGWEATQKKAGQ